MGVDREGNECELGGDMGEKGERIGPVYMLSGKKKDKVRGETRVGAVNRVSSQGGRRKLNPKHRNKNN